MLRIVSLWLLLGGLALVGYDAVSEREPYRRPAPNANTTVHTMEGGTPIPPPRR